MTGFVIRRDALVRASFMSGLLLATMASAAAESVSFTQPPDMLTGLRERPLFTPSRRPFTAAPAPEAAPEPISVEPLAATLLGVVSGDDGTGLAIVKRDGEPEVIRIRIGETIAGWQLDRIESHAAIFSNGGQTITLAFPAPAQDGANAGPNNAGPNAAEPVASGIAPAPLMPEPVSPP